MFKSSLLEFKSDFSKELIDQLKLIFDSWRVKKWASPA